MEKEKIREPQNTERKRRYLSQSDIPSMSLETALRVAYAISDNFAKQPTKPLDVAEAMNFSPNSSHFRKITGSAIAYGLTEGGYNSGLISLTDLGKRIVAPKLEGDDFAAKREAFLKPRIINEFLKRYDNARIPSERIAWNVLEGMDCPAEAVKRAFEIIMEGASELGLIKEIKGNKYVSISDSSSAIPDHENAVNNNFSNSGLVKEEPLESIQPRELPLSRPDKRELGKAIFIGHGKNKKPLEQLEIILKQFQVPYKVATEEPNLGRPISKKVKETMESCNCAIFIFTTDKVFTSEKGEHLFFPSDNAVYELGVAGYLYDNRIVILKEEDVTLSANFNDLGYIPFKKDQLDSQSINILKELIAFGIIKVST